MIKVALIPPTKYLKKFASFNANKYHMVLAQRTLDDKKYALFYNKTSKQGEYIILDNGACELGKSIAKTDLIKAVNLVKPSQIVLPDKLNDGYETVKLSLDFINKIKKIPSLKKINLMAVVQGKTKDEWIWSLNQFKDIKQINTIGISNTDAVFSNTKYEFSRVKTIEYLVKKNLIPHDKKIHLLGLNSSGHIELEKLKRYEFIEGVDTSAPIVHGAHGIAIKSNEKYEKIRKYLDPQTNLNSDQINLIRQNIKQLFKSAGYEG